ncbi:hypothetical protein N0V93_008632 [Gnomoniopsis smithogilvyi]|uniref:Uncharacterized protein n=1 Tax=Gnomoniopsis smithogilvyi TaxID=1191159 RepID=A0A9W8YMC7_9PEZI|nr:hypothetical protein N0V93_008632 [Gnomoniopsis smithogilvyi]
MRPIGSYFGWARGSDSRTSTPAPDDLHPRRTSRQLSWQKSPSEGKKPPFRSLDGLQECFWIEDNLRHTGRQLDTCSERLHGMCDSASRIREELEDLKRMLAAMRTKGGARRDMRDSGSKDSIESPSERPLSFETWTVESSPTQSIQYRETSDETTSYTIASVHTAGESEDTTLEMPLSPQHAPEYLEIFPEILESIEEEDLPFNSVSEAELAASNPVDDVNTMKEEETQYQTPLPVQSSSSHGIDPPQNTHSGDADSEEHQQNPKDVPSSPSQGIHPPKDILIDDSLEEEHQLTPRSVLSTTTEEHDSPQIITTMGNSDEEEDQQTPRSMQSFTVEETHPTHTMVGTLLNEEEHQRTPRSLRPNLGSFDENAETDCITFRYVLGLQNGT